MKKMMLMLALQLFAVGVFAQGRQVIRLVGTDGSALSRVNVRLAGKGYVTDDRGRFSVMVESGGITAVLEVMGYLPKALVIASPGAGELEFAMAEKASELREVEISTGYQRLPRERATGSFVQLDSTLLNRTVATNVLDRLADVAPGLVFNRSVGRNAISIRGTSTIFANAEPLVVLDNFPFDGDLASINPNDIESVTILKDAAASSQWGARAGNGVIVLTTKRGKGKTRVSALSTVSLLERPDPYLVPKMSTSDYIDTEIRLFGEGFYTATETALNRTPMSPVVELLRQRRDHPAMAAEIDLQIDRLRNLDVRGDYDRYYFQRPVSQQYAVSVSGSGQGNSYFVSLGRDHNRLGLLGNDWSRTSLTANYEMDIVSDRLKLSLQLAYMEGRNSVGNVGTEFLGLQGADLYPYAELADASGNPLPIARNYSNGFVAESAERGLLDWAYRPLQEMGLADRMIRSNNLRINGTLKYTVLKGLSAELLYQFGRNGSADRHHMAAESYTARNMINNLTQILADGSFYRPIPIGGILDQSELDNSGHNLRGQLNFSRGWSQRHQLDVIAGGEVRDYRQWRNDYRLYGYDQTHATNRAVDYVSVFPRYVNPLAASVPIDYRNLQRELSDRFLSYYVNLGYTFSGKYTASGSARLDRSNLFGVESNQKGVPLWSLGAAWNIAAEPFMKFSWLDVLKLRTTLGYSGNIDKSLSAYTTASYNSGSSTLTRLPYATVVNPPNPGLRWERIRMLNLGLDFGLWTGRLSGSLEWFAKKGTDLIGTIPYAPSSGVTVLRGNFADTRGQGLDLVLNSVNLQGRVGWKSNFFLSWVSDRVTAYRQAATLNANDFVAGYYASLPLEGRPLYSLYSYRWGGLDPATGNPQGYLDGVLSQNYNAIRAATDFDNVVYHGNARPTTFGALRNEWNYGPLSLSVNMSFRFGYHFRKPTIGYGSNYGLGGHGDYAMRWRSPGDEAWTDVPSVPSTAQRNIAMRNTLYVLSEALVDRGDHIRLQDIRLDFRLPSTWIATFGLQRANVYALASNVGMIWAANKWGIDPDFHSVQWPLSYALGINLTF